MFVGRKTELKELGERFASDRFEVIMVSGKRRVGKSQLIVEALSSFSGPTISYECFKTSYRANLSNIEALVKQSHSDYLHFGSLYDVILFLHDNAVNGSSVFVIDEYPYMREGEATDSEIKNAIDAINALPKQNPLKIVLCGSSIDVMGILDEPNKPLYGRFTSKIALKELNYLESASFFPRASTEDKINYYCLLGGVPYYLKQIDEKKSFKENVIRLFFADNPFLKTELDALVYREIAKIENAPFLMSIIGRRTCSYSDILQVYHSSYPDKSIDYVLGRLVSIDAIEKIMVHQDNHKQKPYYRIASNSLRFYYSYLERSFANRLLFRDVDYYEEFIEEDLLTSFIPHAFERVGMEFLALMNRKGLLKNRLRDLYPYVINDRVKKKNYEFDVVGECEEGLIDYECKYQDKPIDPREVYAESRQASLANERFIKTVFISKSKVLGEGNESYGLDDLFAPALL